MPSGCLLQKWIRKALAENCSDWKCPPPKWSFKGANINSIHNLKAWMYGQSFENLFRRQFVPEVGLYWKRGNLAHTTVLLPDCGSRYPCESISTSDGGHTVVLILCRHCHTCYTSSGPRNDHSLETLLVLNRYHEGENVIAFCELEIVLAAKCGMSHTWSSVNPVILALVIEGISWSRWRGFAMSPIWRNQQVQTKFLTWSVLWEMLRFWTNRMLMKAVMGPDLHTIDTDTHCRRCC